MKWEDNILWIGPEDCDKNGGITISLGEPGPTLWTINDIDDEGNVIQKIEYLTSDGDIVVLEKIYPACNFTWIG